MKGYNIVRNYLLEHDVTDSLNLPVDIIFNENRICRVDDYIVEVRFYDKMGYLSYYYIYKYNNDTYEAVLVEKDKECNKIINEIRLKAHEYYSQNNKWNIAKVLGLT